MFQYFNSTLFIKLVNVISLHLAVFPNFQTKVDRVCPVSRNLKDLSNNVCRNILVNKVIVMEREEN